MNKALVVFSFLLLVIAAGCLGQKEELRDKPAAFTPAPEIARVMPVADIAQKEVSVTERKVVSTASFTMEVKNVQVTFDEIMKIVQANLGYISSSSIYDTGGRKEGKMTVRVPQKSFYSTIGQIEALGTIKSKQVSGQDVTEEFIDLNARLGNLKRQEARLQEILTNATTVKDVLEVEKELERVRGEIERLTGRLNYLNQSVEMSTINVNAMEPAPIAGENLGIVDALKDAARGFIDSVKGIIIFVGYVLPIAVFIVVIYLIALGIKRKVLPRLKM